MEALERFLLLQTIDERWREHLFDMDYLREGIHLRGFAQIDPLVAYKNEAFTLFGDLMNSVWSDYARMIFNVQVNIEGSNGGGEPGAASEIGAGAFGGFAVLSGEDGGELFWARGMSESAGNGGAGASCGAAADRVDHHQHGTLFVLQGEVDVIGSAKLAETDGGKFLAHRADHFFREHFYLRVLRVAREPNSRPVM